MMFLLAFQLALVPPLVDMTKMQGEWQLKFSTDGKPRYGYVNGIPVLIKSNQIISLSKNENKRQIFLESDNTQALNRFGIDPLSKPKKIGICWSEGIFELNGDTMRFCIK